MTNIRNALMQAAGTAASGGSTYVEDVFSTTLYTGNNTNGTDIVNGIDLSGEGGLVWLKRRDGDFAHFLFNTESAQPYHYLSSDSTNAVNTTSSDTLVGFNNNGFTLDDDNSYVGGMNTSGHDYASWTFRKQEGFFDVVTYTGDGTSARTVSHNLGCKPGMIIVKRTDSSADWQVWHRNTGLTYNVAHLNTTAAWTNTGGDNAAFADAYGNATNFTLGAGSRLNDTNENSATYVAYLFAGQGDADSQIFGDDGDEAIIKTGSYNGDGTTNGSKVIDTGFEPQWVLIKRTDGLGHWLLLDNMRGIPFGAVDQCLVADTTAAENGALGAASLISLTSTGFALNSTAINNSSQSYIYMAIRRGPMKEPSAGTDVLGLDASHASSYENPFFQGNNVVDQAFWRSSTGGANYSVSRLLQGSYLQAQDQSAAGSTSQAVFDYMNGFYDIGSGSASGYYAAMFTRYPKVFDTVVYTGTGSNTTHAHNLGVVPEMMIIKQTSNADYGWFVYESNGGKDKYMYLNGVDQQNTSSNIFGNTPTATTIVANPTNNYINASGETHLALLFASLTGISKVGTYTGTGNDLNVTGLGAAARWVMIKRTDSSGDWYVFDTLRGIVAGNDDYFLMNTTGADVTNTDYIDPHSSGFTVTSSAPDALNASGGTYLYLAFA